jgi:tRNA-splicing ligase RtcB
MSGKSQSPKPLFAPYHRWGDDIDTKAVEQMENACSLPVSVAGALMPDAHVGYGLPIGGVLATDNAVIPYAVGVDIACRMKMSVLDLPVTALSEQKQRLTQALNKQTRFGIGAAFKPRRQHPVMDQDWGFAKPVADLKDKAWSQLGTSGSGNHFVLYAVMTLDQDRLGLKAGKYVVLLSHSGSRGTGHAIASLYSRLAMRLNPRLPQKQRHLAWLDLAKPEGREYWQAMELMGSYASANHEIIHRHIAQHLGAEVLLEVENHHNFAWKEAHQGRKVIVHRKGAILAEDGCLAIIPGTMATPGYVVRGLGEARSLNSAAHGAGRRMSRKQAKKQFSWHYLRQTLKEQGVELLSAGRDEAPQAYKDIHEVMAAQRELVEPLARLDPKIVKMAPAGEKPED